MARTPDLAATATDTQDLLATVLNADWGFDLHFSDALANALTLALLDGDLLQDPLASLPNP